MSTDIATIQPVRVSEVNRSSLSYFIGQLIAEAVLVSGFNVSREAQLFMLEQAPKDIQTRFKLLELPEIKKAFDDGVRGVYGEYFGISVLTINKWLKAYIENGEHQKYLESKIIAGQKLLPKTAPLSQKEIDNIMISGIVNSYNDFKNTGVALDYGSPKINWLLNKGIIKPTEEQREDFKDQAKQMLTEEAETKSLSLNRTERAEGKKLLDELVNMLESDNKIVSLAKNICLKEWFEEVIATGDNINQYFTDYE